MTETKTLAEVVADEVCERVHEAMAHREWRDDRIYHWNERVTTLRELIIQSMEKHAASL